MNGNIEYEGGGATVTPIEPRNKQDYLHELRRLAKLPRWKKFQCGLLSCELSLGEFSSGRPRADGQGLQVQDETDQDLLRKKCIASMRSWVVRNLKDDWVDTTVKKTAFNTRKKDA